MANSYKVRGIKMFHGNISLHFSSNLKFIYPYKSLSNLGTCLQFYSEMERNPILRETESWESVDCLHGIEEKRVEKWKGKGEIATRYLGLTEQNGGMKSILIPQGNKIHSDSSIFLPSCQTLHTDLTSIIRDFSPRYSIPKTIVSHAHHLWYEINSNDSFRL